MTKKKESEREGGKNDTEKEGERERRTHRETGGQKRKERRVRIEWNMRSAWKA